MARYSIRWNYYGIKNSTSMKKFACLYINGREIERFDTYAQAVEYREGVKEYTEFLLENSHHLELKNNYENTL